nr:hypothetical protein [Nostoc sp. PCC 7120 = FACHB-418]
MKLLQGKGYIHFNHTVFIILFGRRKAIIDPHAASMRVSNQAELLKTLKAICSKLFQSILLKITHISAQYQLVAERFNIPVPLPPLEIGKEILNEKSLSVSLIIGVAWSNEDKDWRYLVVDEGFNTPPLWVSAAQIQGEMFA